MTVHRMTSREEKVQDLIKMDEGEKHSLCTTKRALLFLICSDFKVQKSGFIRDRTPSAAVSHISFVGLQTNRSNQVEGSARLRFDKLDSCSD